MRRLAMFVVLLLGQITASEGLLFLGNGTTSTCAQGGGRVRWIPGESLDREWMALETEIMPHASSKTDFAPLHAPPLDDLRQLNSLPFVEMYRFSLKMARETVRLEIRSPVEDLHINFLGADGFLDAEPFVCPYYCKSAILTLTRLDNQVRAVLDSQHRTVRVNETGIVQFLPTDEALIRIIEVPFLSIRDTAYTTNFQLELAVRKAGSHACLTYWRRSSISPHANIRLSGEMIALRGYGPEWKEARFSNLTSGTHSVIVSIHSTPAFDTPGRFSFVLLLSTVCQADSVYMSAPSHGCSAGLISTHVPDGFNSVCEGRAGRSTTCDCPDCKVCSETECDCSLRPTNHPSCAAETTIALETGESAAVKLPTGTPQPTTQTPAVETTPALVATPTLSVTSTAAATTTPATTPTTPLPESPTTPLKTIPAEETTAAAPRTTTVRPTILAPTVRVDFDVVQPEVLPQPTFPPTVASIWVSDLEVVPNEMDRETIDDVTSIQMSGNNFAMLSIAGGAALAFSLGAVIKFRCSVRPWVQTLLCACRPAGRQDYDVEMNASPKDGKSEEESIKVKSERRSAKASKPTTSRAAPTHTAAPPSPPEPEAFIYGSTPPSMGPNMLDLEVTQPKTTGGGRDRSTRGKRVGVRASTRPASVTGAQRWK